MARRALSKLMDFRTLDPKTDRAVVTSLFDRAADYVMLETGRPPNARTIDAFFDDRPPGIDPQGTTHLGVFDDGGLIGVLAHSFGYPEPSDAYVGLLLMASDIRGRGLGRRLLDHATDMARKRHATRQLIAVLDANLEGRAFWERNGFALERTFPPSDDGHIRHRMTRDL